MSTATQPTQLRALPKSARPVRNETLASFLARLGRRNGMPHGYLHRLLRTTDLPMLDAVAALIDAPRHTLAATLPELRTGESPIRPRARRPAGFEGTILACQLCSARRTGDIGVSVWANSEHVVCHHHQRWIGSPTTPTSRQISVATTPEILAANRSHHRLLRDRDVDQTRAAFLDAATIVDHWHRRGRLPDVAALTRTLYGSAPPAHPGGADPEIHAAQYPTIVRLAQLLADPRWVRAATRSPRAWQRATTHIAETITSGYVPDNLYDALVQWKLAR